MPHLNEARSLTADQASAFDAQLAAFGGTANPLRLDALAKLKARGFPTRRDEDWRYMDLADISGSAPALAAQLETPAALPATVSGGTVALFQNGYLNEGASDMAAIAALGAPDASPLESDLETADGLTLANRALGRDGLLLNIGADTAPPRPLHLVQQSAAAGSAAVHLRHALHLEAGAQLTLVEHCSGDASNYWNNIILQLTLEAGSRLTHIRLIGEGERATHTSKCLVDVHEKAVYQSFTLTSGGKAVRTESHVRLLGSGADANIDGMSLAKSGQRADTFIHMQHLVPGATSDQVHRSVLAGRGKAAFQGRILVARDAQQTLADQSCKSLLLDRTAEANAKPELEIFADDVKCSHGATVGELDEKALFYMLARGIDPATARGMLVEAFAAEAFARVGDEVLKADIQEKLHAWLGGEKAGG